MGYSIAIRCKNKALQEQMISFMDENYRNWPEISGMDIHAYSNFTDELSYDSNKRAIGFDYNACEPERDYIFAVVRWLALKIGKKIKWKELGRIPFYVYDGCEPVPILTESDWKGVPDQYKWARVSDMGFKPVELKLEGTPIYQKYKKRNAIDEFMKKYMSIYYDHISGGYKRVNELIENELKRLDKLWMNYGTV